MFAQEPAFLSLYSVAQCFLNHKSVSHYSDFMDDEIKLRKHKQLAHSDSGANLKLSPSRAHVLGGVGAPGGNGEIKRAELTLGIFSGEA